MIAQRIGVHLPRDCLNLIVEFVQTYGADVPAALQRPPVDNVSIKNAFNRACRSDNFTSWISLLDELNHSVERLSRLGMTRARTRVWPAGRVVRVRVPVIGSRRPKSVAELR
ncbi:hypothetical protein BDR03DRAFT_957158 [Suillus americanus]|nr:hypothetical protein BDR03DRAFT_957158 [Suillus americanus]